MLATTKEISGLACGSFVHMCGKLKYDERVKLGSLEVVVIGTVSETSIADDPSLDKRLD